MDDPAYLWKSTIFGHKSQLIDMKVRTIHNVGEVIWCVENGWNRLTGGGPTDRWIIMTSKSLLTVSLAARLYLQCWKDGSANGDRPKRTPYRPETPSPIKTKLHTIHYVRRNFLLDETHHQLIYKFRSFETLQLTLNWKVFCHSYLLFCEVYVS
jgi:hypothetical protein